MLDTKLQKLLSEKKSAVLKRWFDSVLETYPAETVSFLKKQNNPFADPVGSTIYNGLESLFEQFLQGTDFNDVPVFLDDIIRIRAIQDFTPSQAISFIFLLKKAIRKELWDEIHEHQMFEELLRLESEIDKIIKISFDIYMKCREKIYELKANEVKNWTYRLLQRTNMVKEIKMND